MHEALYTCIVVSEVPKILVLLILKAVEGALTKEALRSKN